MSKEKWIVEVDISGDCPFCEKPRMSHNFFLGGRGAQIVCDKAPRPQGMSPYVLGSSRVVEGPNVGAVKRDT